MAEVEAFRQVLDAHGYYMQLRYEHWVQYEAYTGMWWLLLATWLAPWAAWLALVDRRRLAELCLCGGQVMFITTVLDAAGANQRLWTYPIKLIPFTPHLEPVDWGIVPVTFMLVYQYFPSWKGFLAAQVVVAAVYSFIAEPFLATVVGVYLPLRWPYYYSFPGYLALAIVTRASTLYILAMERKTGRAPGTDR